jgi:hypothetical protein
MSIGPNGVGFSPEDGLESTPINISLNKDRMVDNIQKANMGTAFVDGCLTVLPVTRARSVGY